MSLCSFFNCINGLYIQYRAALNVNPTLAKQLRSKMEKANAIVSMYYAAEACASDADMTIQLARLSNLFAGDPCVGSGIPTGGVLSANGTFTEEDLTTEFMLTIVHNLNTLLITSLTIIDPDDVSQAVTPTIVDVNTVSYNFGAALPAGTYTWIVIAAS